MASPVCYNEIMAVDCIALIVSVLSLIVALIAEREKLGAYWRDVQAKQKLRLEEKYPQQAAETPMEALAKALEHSQQAEMSKERGLFARLRYYRRLEQETMKSTPDRFQWVPVWFLFSFGIFIVSAILWLQPDSVWVAVIEGAGIGALIGAIATGVWHLAISAAIRFYDVYNFVYWVFSFSILIGLFGAVISALSWLILDIYEYSLVGWTVAVAAVLLILTVASLANYLDIRKKQSAQQKSDH